MYSLYVLTSTGHCAVWHAIRTHDTIYHAHDTLPLAFDTTLCEMMCVVKWAAEPFGLSNPINCNRIYKTLMDVRVLFCLAQLSSLLQSLSGHISSTGPPTPPCLCPPSLYACALCLLSTRTVNVTGSPTLQNYNDHHRVHVTRVWRARRAPTGVLP